MTNCTITLDVTGFGYTYLLQLDAMLGDFLEDGDNAAAADTLHDWIAENARNFTDDARANGDTLAADIFSDMAAWDEGGNDPEENDDEEPANEPAEIEKYFDIDDEWKTIYAEVDHWRNDPANENHAAALEGNAIDAKNAPDNLYRAGVFAGLAEAAAWAIYARGICTDDINAITAAIYKAYGLPW